MSKHTIKIGGMSCEHCQKAVTEALEALKGVSDVSVDLALGSARFESDGALGEDALRSAIEDIGFDYLG